MAEDSVVRCTIQSADPLTEVLRARSSDPGTGH